MPRAPGRALPPGHVRYGEAAGRWVLLATVLGTGMAFIDGTVVNIALPRIGHDLGSGAVRQKRRCFDTGVVGRRRIEVNDVGRRRPQLFRKRTPSPRRARYTKTSPPRRMTSRASNT